jgi:hypothetical protein
VRRECARPAAVDPSQAAEVARLLAEFDEYFSAAFAVAAALVGSQHEASDAMFARMGSAAYRGRLTRFRDAADRRCTDAVAVATSDSDRAKVTGVAIAGTGLAASLVFGLLAVLSVECPVESVVDSFNDVASGDGGTYIDRTRVSPIRQADGRSTRWLRIHRDVTEAKRTRGRAAASPRPCRGRGARAYRRARACARAAVARIFLGKPETAPDGTAVREEFYRQLTGNTPAQVRAYWARLIFTYSGHPPRQLDAAGRAKLLGDNPRAIGYVDRAAGLPGDRIVYSPAPWIGGRPPRARRGRVACAGFDVGCRASRRPHRRPVCCVAPSDLSPALRCRSPPASRPRPSPTSIPRCSPA